MEVLSGVHIYFHMAGNKEDTEIYEIWCRVAQQHGATVHGCSNEKIAVTHILSRCQPDKNSKLPGENEAFMINVNWLFRSLDQWKRLDEKAFEWWLQRQYLKRTWLTLLVLFINFE